MKKKVACLTVFIGLLMASVCYGSENISITVDGEELETDTPAQIIEGRTMVPLRAIFEALGANVEWDGGSKSIKAQKGDVSIDMQIDNKTFKVGSDEKELDVPPLIIDGRTMVPARAVAESLDCDVEWDGAGKNVIITSSDKAVTEETTEAAEETTEETTETTTEEITEETTETVTEKWIEYFMSRDDKPEPMDGFMFNGQLEKDYHIQGRRIIETNMICLFGGGYIPLYDMYTHISSDKNTQINIAFDGVWDDFILSTQREYESAKGFNEYIGFMEREAKINELQNELYLIRNNIMGYSYTAYDDSTQVVLFSMLDEDESGLCSYIIDFVKRDDILQYSLVRTDDGTYTVKEEKGVVSGNGEIVGGGMYVEEKATGLENDKRAFLEKVSELVKESEFLDS